MSRPADRSDVASAVLVFAPIGRDAALTHDFLDRASIRNVICRTMNELCDIVEGGGGGALLLTEEAVDDPAWPRLIALLDGQPSWADIPVLLFAGSVGADVSVRPAQIESLRNVTLFERPIRLAAVLSAIRAALRARARQYEVRDLLAELRQARAAAEAANRLKDEFLATLSHELRTPLNAIVGWTSMLTRGQVDPARMQRVFEALDRNARAQAHLIADVLDVSRIVTGKLQLQVSEVDVCDLAAQAAESVRAAAGEKGIRLVVKAEGRRCWVRGDADRLQQVVWNLLSNAIKFTPAGGSIRVHVARDDQDVELSVADTGAGIPQEFLAHVFDRFRQADQTTTRVHGGLGLGLSIVKHLVELHGGTVSVSSAGKGRGACFTVRLPAVQPALADASSVPAVPPAAAVSLAGRTILVVDDDASTREVISAVLERSGAEVYVAASAAEGWDVLHDRRPDVLVADLAMPEEDGFSFMRRVRHTANVGERLPAIALSAFADARSEESARAAGFSAFLAKPARPDALLGLIDRLLNTPVA